MKSATSSLAVVALLGLSRRSAWTILLGVMSFGGVAWMPAKSNAEAWSLPLAQFSDSTSDPFAPLDGQAGSVGIPWNSWQVETGIMVLVFLAAWMFCFFFLFDWLVRTKRWWPMSAYGFCAGLVLFICFCAATAVFWEDLIIPGDTFLTTYGLRAAVVAAGSFIGFLTKQLIRSEHGAATA